MKKILIIFLLLFTNLNAANFELEKIISGLDGPWSLSFIDNQKPDYQNILEKVISKVNIYFNELVVLRGKKKCLSLYWV